MPLSFDEMRESASALSKGVAAGAWKDVEALLKRLRDHAEPTEEQIRSTKLGKTIGTLRKSSEPHVAEMAKAIVKKWRNKVEADKAKEGKKKPDAKAPASVKAETPKSGSPAASASPSKASPVPTTSSPAKPAKPEPTASSSKPAPVRSFVKIDFDVLGDRVRNACLKLLFQSLEVDIKDDKVPAYEVALDVEKAVFSKVGNGQTNGDYKAKVRSLSLNLKDKNNPDLRRSVLDGQIEPERLVVMTPEEMASDARKAERQRLQAQNLFNARAAEPQEAETDMFECSRCHQRKVRYFEKQTRSADEPMTVFCTCTVCNFRWKFS